MAKRILTLCIVALIGLALFAGCNRGDEEGAWGGRHDLPDEERWFGRFDDTVTVRLAYPSNAAHEWQPGDSPSDNLWTREFYERFNIQVEIMWEAVHAGGDYETRLNLAIASGDVPDFIRFDNATQFANMQQAGQLFDMSWYFERFAYPLVQELMNADGIAMTWGRVGDGLYGIPTDGVSLGSPRMLYMRRDWFEATGLPMPTTIEEFWHTTETMARQNNAFVTAVSRSIIRNGMSDIQGPSNAFGAFPTQWVDDGQGGLVYGSLDMRVRTVLERYAQWFAEGLLDPGFSALDGGAMGEQLTTSRIAGMSSMVWLSGWPLAGAWGTEHWTEWIMLPILPSETLQTPLMVTADAGAASRLVSIREGFRYPEAFFKMWNFATAMLEDQERGQQEIFHPRFMDNPFTYFPDPMQNPTTHRNLTALINGTPIDQVPMREHCRGRWFYFERYFAGEMPETDTIWGHWVNWIGDYSGWGILTNYMDRGQLFVCRTMGLQTDSMVAHWADLTDLESVFFIEVMSGQRPITDFENYFIPTWHAMGGTQITAEVNEWWAARN